MKTRFWLAAPVLAAVGVVVVFAHPDDPKARDLLPRYEGPGYRASERGNPPAFPSSGVALFSWFTLPEIHPSATSGADCWGYVSPSGREYAIMTVSNGTAFYEVTNPAAATQVAFLSGPTSLWRDPKTYGHYAYCVSEGGSGIQVFDLSQIDSGIVTSVGSFNASGTGATHNVAINTETGRLYQCGGGNNGLRIYDLSANPANPAFLGAWTDRYVHDAQIVNWAKGPFAGREIAFCCSGFNGGSVQTGLDILDVTNPAGIQVISRISYPNASYSHQGWLSDDRRFFYLGDELDEGDVSITTTTIVINVEDLQNPFVAGEFDNGVPTIGHNMYTVGKTLYQANYRSGLRVFDASYALDPTEVAYFDTDPTGDARQFQGAWNVYPYLPSGTVIVSDLERGLFVLGYERPKLSFDFPNGIPTALPPTGGSMIVDVIQNGATLDPLSPTLYVDNGAGFVGVAMTDLGGGMYRADFPSMTCGTNAQFYISAATTGADTVTHPFTAPTKTNVAAVYDTLNVIVDEHFDADTGWTAGAPGDTATTGIWERVTPIGSAAQANEDATPGSGGVCFVTQQAVGAVGDHDVDGGFTNLISPAYDLSDTADPYVSYARWYDNSRGGDAHNDTFLVFISDNDGATWTPLETVGPAGSGTVGGWIRVSFRVSDVVALTDKVRLRFEASDLGAGSLIEAGVDDVRITDAECAPAPCPGDVSGNGAVGLEDVAGLLASFGLCDGDAGYLAAADLDGNDCVELADLGGLLAVFGVICP
ncbi:MAG: choice-of-anchor B family protein [Phycisphaerales bacterium]|nr:choice-of-anchor B family protein [Phycisphaerales bacterium]